jgi:hypothetical protein
MNLAEKEANYYQRIESTFIEKKVVAVYYEEIGFPEDDEYWEHSNEIHSVDMNVIFRFENDEFAQLKWSDEFHSFGIGLETLKEIDYRDGIKTIEVTKSSNWQNLIGKSISEINVIWDGGTSTEYSEDSKVEPKQVEFKIPESWEISFGDLRIWISAFEIEEGGNTKFWADNLSVFFSESAQQKYNIAT